VLSIEAVALLKERGFTALRMEDGVPEWRAFTWPIETGASNP
jgi:ArsR family transcriptional regulator